MGPSAADVRAVASNLFLFGLVLGMAGTIEPKAFEKRVREYRGLMMGLASQFFLLPFLGFLVVRAFRLEPVAGITLLITTTSPGGGFSGLLCSICNADLALSVAMTTVSTVMAMFLIPLNCLIYINSLYGVSVQLPWGSLFLSVSVVVLAVAVGLAMSAKRPDWSNNLNRIGTVCGMANIALAALSNGSSDTPFWSHPPLFLFAVGLPCLSGLVLSFLVSRYALGINGPQAVAICIECCYQNTALAITVALSVFRDDAGYAAGIPLIYGAIEPLVIIPFCLLAWKAGWTYGAKDLGFFEWVSNNYQPSAHDEDSAEAPPSRRPVSTDASFTLSCGGESAVTASAGQEEQQTPLSRSDSRRSSATKPQPQLKAGRSRNGSLGILL